MKILGISAFYHDSAAVLLDNGEIIAAAQEERFTRIKHDPAFPSNAVKFCLQYASCSINDLDAIVFYDKPFLKFERLLETYYAFAPKGLFSFLRSMPVWIKEKLFMKKIIMKELKKIEPLNGKKLKLLFPEHHLSHAASAFYPSNFEEAAILTIDGVGEWATASICRGNGNKIEVLKELHFPHSPGLLYSAFTYYCGFKVNSGEYKLMGLAPYGNKESPGYEKYVSLIKSTLLDIKDDGSIFLNQEYFNYAVGSTMTNNAKWKELFGFGRRIPESELDQRYCDLALAIQSVIEDIVFKMVNEAKRLTGSRNLCMAGGVALNCVVNGKLHESGLFENIFIQPAAGDAGGALGAAYAAHYIYFGSIRESNNEVEDSLKGTYLGPAFSNDEIAKHLRKFNADFIWFDNFEELAEKVSILLNQGNIIGWFQGRMEFGPRALGSRSILADPRNSSMQKKLNLNIKFREGFRPFAPAVLLEKVSEYFDLEKSSPYMMLVSTIKKNKRTDLPAGYHQLSVNEKLYFLRSSLPAITHVDYTARIQTVDKKTNFLFWQLLQHFEKLTGCAVLINTSFNVRGEPIVNSPEDAYRCFMQTEMDYLVIGNYLFDKKLQPEWKQKKEDTTMITIPD